MKSQLLSLVEEAQKNRTTVVKYVKKLRSLATTTVRLKALGDRIASLLTEASRTYYIQEEINFIEIPKNNGPEIEDYEFDLLKDLLTEISPKHTFFQTVGTPVSGAKPKVKHDELMGSLDKETSLVGLKKWFDNYTRQKDTFMTDKMDGNAATLCYEGGILVSGATRGDGEFGEDISINVKKMQVPQSIPIKNKVKVTAELIIYVNDWVTHFLNTAKGKKKPKNPRNTAAGTARRDDGIGAEHIRVYAIKIKVYGSHTYKGLETRSGQIALLMKLGFSVPTNDVAHTFDDISRIISKYQTTTRKSLPYQIDGIVIEDNDCAYIEELGMSNNRPRAAIAFKFESDFAETVLENVIWQVGRTGVITPVAIVVPVTVAGVTINRASLVSPAEILRLKIGLGSDVRMERRNDVIPKITAAITPGKKIVLPGKCPSCAKQTTLSVSSSAGPIYSIPVTKGDGADLVDRVLKSHGVEAGEFDAASLECLNEACDAKATGLILHFLSVLDVKGFGEKMVDKLYASGKIKTPADLYQLQVDDISSLERLGEKSATNVLNELAEQSKSVTLPRFIKALGIPLFAESFAETVSTQFPTLDSMMKAKAADLCAIHGIGDKVSEAIVSGLKSRAPLIAALKKHVTITNRPIGAFSGKTVCFTGFRDAQLKSEIEAAGGRVVDSYSKSLAYLIAKDASSSSSKLDKAKKDGVSVISADDVRKIME
jgi:DNA ligase (NAD+)